MPTVNADRLQQTFARLDAYPRRNPALDDPFRALILNGGDDDVSRINAHRLAERWSRPVDQVVTWLLFASRVGLFELNWESHCPHCTGLAGLDFRVGHIAHDTLCPMCQRDFEVHADENVEVTFTISPAIRSATPSLATFVPANIRLIGIYEGRETLPLTFDAPGQYFLIDVQRGHPDAMARFDVEPGNPPLSAATLTFHPELVEPKCTELAPGEITITIQGTQKVMLVYRNTSDGIAVPARITGLDTMLMPDFKEIFSSETLSQRESLSIRSLTLMFTDITGSTALYQRLGDARAYNLVRDHFEVLFKQIETQHGVVTKTIGDAVMAVFATPEAALQAALHMQHGIRQFNQSRTPEQGIVLVKIGLHTGSAIAVNLNNTLDYFGNMVNLAARIQSKSRSEEVLMSEETYQDRSVQALIAKDSDLVMSESLFDLHGIGEKRLISVMTKLA